MGGDTDRLGPSPDGAASRVHSAEGVALGGVHRWRVPVDAVWVGVKGGSIFSCLANEGV